MREKQQGTEVKHRKQNPGPRRNTECQPVEAQLMCKIDLVSHLDKRNSVCFRTLSTPGKRVAHAESLSMSYRGEFGVKGRNREYVRAGQRGGEKGKAGRQRCVGKNRLDGEKMERKK